MFVSARTEKSLGPQASRSRMAHVVYVQEKVVACPEACSRCGPASALSPTVGARDLFGSLNVAFLSVQCRQLDSLAIDLGQLRFEAD